MFVVVIWYKDVLLGFWRFGVGEDGGWDYIGILPTKHININTKHKTQHYNITNNYNIQTDKQNTIYQRTYNTITKIQTI